MRAQKCYHQPHIDAWGSGRSGAPEAGTRVSSSRGWYSRKEGDAAKYPKFEQAAPISQHCIPAEVDLDRRGGSAERAACKPDVVRIWERSKSRAEHGVMVHRE